MSYKSVIAAIALISAVFSCKSSSKSDNSSDRPSGTTFTQEELLILSQSDSVMYLTVVTDKSDSLILRKVSRDLTQEELDSPEAATLARNLLATVRDPSQDGVGDSGFVCFFLAHLIANIVKTDECGKIFPEYVERKNRLLWRNFSGKCGMIIGLVVPRARSRHGKIFPLILIFESRHQ